MRRLALLAALVTSAVVLAACSRPGAALPDPTISAVSPASLSPDTTLLTITGADFYGYPNGAGARVEFCGVSAPAELVEPQLRTVTLAPAGRLRVETGGVLRVRVPGGLTPGVSALRVVLPDGREVVLAEGVTCAVEEDEPTPNRAPTARVALASHEPAGGSRLLTYVSESTDPDGDQLELAWSAWTLPLMSEEEPELEPVDGVVEGDAFSVTRPDADFHFLRLTVTDPDGLSDTTTFVTIVDPIGESTLEGQPEPQQLDEPAPALVDAVRASWTADPDEGVTRYEVEFADAFTLPVGLPGACVEPEPTLAGSLALGPQQVDGLPEMIGLFLFVPGVDFDDPGAVESPSMLAMFAVPDENGSYFIFDSEASDPCDTGSALAEVRPTVEGNVLRFAVPSAVVGVDSVMMGIVGSTDDGLMDIIPEIPFLPILPIVD